MIEILPIETPSLGDRSYLAHDGTVALVIDPQRDIDRVTELAAKHGVRITHVFETHIHNDYVTGGKALADAVGAAYHVNGADEVSFERVPVADGDEVHVGDTMLVRVIATPGHTFTHLSYGLADLDKDGTVVGVFTGGSLLFGSTGRPDLLGPEHTDELAGHQYDSAQRLARELPGSAMVLPTHGFGSFCSSSQSDATESTIEQEREDNAVLRQTRQEWVEQMLSGLGAWPAYYVHMAPRNAEGPQAPSLDAPAPADKATVAQRLHDGEWVVDLRSRTAFAASHVTGTYNFGTDGPFSTYLGWMIPWGAPLTLLGDNPEQIAEAQRELVRIGIDRVAGAAHGSPQDWTDETPASFERATFADLLDVRHHREVAVLDVRRDEERAESRIPGSAHIPIHEVLERIDQAPHGEVWVHCASGYRASVAASVLAAHGRKVVAVDDDYERALTLGLATKDQADA